MSSATSRRAFLRGRVSEMPVQRPPGAGHEMAFCDTCTQCGDCVAACPENVITTDSSGRPFLDFSAGECTFCNACTEACEPSALRAENAWIWRAKIDSKCLSVNGVHCRSCEDHCDERAIGFRLQTGGKALPILDDAICTGCGGCIAACPVGAISFKQQNAEVCS